MSTSIDQSFIRDYQADVTHVFQREGGYLRNTLRMKTGIVGKSTTFQKVGKGTATTKGRHGVISPMNQDHTPIECTMQDRYAGDWVDKLDEAKVNIDERMVIAKGGAWACGRAVDDDAITAMDGTTQTPITLTFDTKANVLAHLLEWCEALDANDVPNDGQRYGLLTPRGWSAAMTVEEFNSADFVMANGMSFSGQQGAPVQQLWKPWNGVLWKVHTGLPGVGGATAKGFLYHKNAVGYGMGVDVTADITWHGDHAAHFVNHMFSGGACLIDDTGVIEGAINDTTAIPTT